MRKTLAGITVAAAIAAVPAHGWANGPKPLYAIPYYESSPEIPAGGVITSIAALNNHPFPCTVTVKFMTKANALACSISVNVPARNSRGLCSTSGPPQVCDVACAPGVEGAGHAFVITSGPFCKQVAVDAHLLGFNSNGNAARTLTVTKYGQGNIGD